MRPLPSDQTCCLQHPANQGNVGRIHCLYSRPCFASDIEDYDQAPLSPKTSGLSSKTTHHRDILALGPHLMTPRLVGFQSSFTIYSRYIIQPVSCPTTIVSRQASDLEASPDHQASSNSAQPRSHLSSNHIHPGMMLRAQPMSLGCGSPTRGHAHRAAPPPKVAPTHPMGPHCRRLVIARDSGKVRLTRTGGMPLITVYQQHVCILDCGQWCRTATTTPNTRAAESLLCNGPFTAGSQGTLAS